MPADCTGELQVRTSPSSSQELFFASVHLLRHRRAKHFRRKRGKHGTRAREHVPFFLKAKALKPLNSAIARVLQLHPRNEDFWLIAEGVERSAKGDLDSCRSILQTAVKANPESVKLWVAYFRLELEFLQRIVEKQAGGTLSKELVEGEIPKIVLQEALKTLPATAVNDFLQVSDTVSTPTALRDFIVSLRDMNE